MRINKFFTEQGYCSRREADRLIEAGRVTINGKHASLGDQVAEGDQVFVDGKLLQFNPPKVYIMYHKPLGITCTTDLGISGNIVDAIKHRLRIFPIGRLDKDSTGLIFLTNDGDIVNKILRAQFGHEKEYIVTTMSPFNDAFLEKMQKGVDIGDHQTLPCKASRINASTFSLILTEGKNRQIRRMCEALGSRVRHLKRVRIMNVELGDLKSGEWRDIPSEKFLELQQLISRAEVSNAHSLEMNIEE